jgi:hypothetical protein
MTGSQTGIPLLNKMYAELKITSQRADLASFTELS